MKQIEDNGIRIRDGDLEERYVTTTLCPHIFAFISFTLNATYKRHHVKVKAIRRLATERP